MNHFFENAPHPLKTRDAFGRCEILVESLSKIYDKSSPKSKMFVNFSHFGIGRF
jgi:hypothetical protein